MSLSLPAMNAAVVCGGKELEAYAVKREGTSSLTAFIASEAGKVRAVSPPLLKLRTTVEPTVSRFSNSKSRTRTICSTFSLPFSCTSMGDWFNLDVCKPRPAANS